jgi:hypothetical protein
MGKYMKKTDGWAIISIPYPPTNGEPEYRVEPSKDGRIIADWDRRYFQIDGKLQKEDVVVWPK